MRGLSIHQGRLEARDDLPRPSPEPGESRVRVLRAGICATDLALRKGYMAFEDVPGHEFVGVAVDGPLAGQRVVGEINAACGSCAECRRGLGRHCPRRTVLGILGRPGAFAEEIALPSVNLHPVPASVPTDAAVFTEPLAAAFEIAEQVKLEPGARALVAGDGKLGILCSWVLWLAGLEVTVAGRHPERRAMLPPDVEHRTGLLETEVAWFAVDLREPCFDLAVEATGRPDVLPRLIPRVRPRGTLVLKTTSERTAPLDTSPIVVNELNVVGSRCGLFGPALEALVERRVPVERLVDARYPLTAGSEAFDHAARPGALKVLFDLEV